MDTKERLELMGQVVTVHQEYERRYDGDYRYWKPVGVEPRAGWVTGFRALQNGTYHDGGYHHMPHLRKVEHVPCILVAYWPTYNPVQVPLDSFELGGEPHYTYNYNLDWLREIMSEEMKHWPRDENGHWVAQEDWTEEQRRTYERRGKL